MADVDDLSEEEKEQLKNQFPQAEAYSQVVGAEYYHEADAEGGA